MKVIKRVKKGNGSQLEEFDLNKIINAVKKAYSSQNKEIDEEVLKELNYIPSYHEGASTVDVETIQNEVEKILMDLAPYDVARAYIIWREVHKKIRIYAENKIAFINRYKNSSNTANATIDDNSNVNSKNIGILNAEIHKEDNIHISRRMMVNKLEELFPDFRAKNYIDDLNNHIIYKHDENSFAGAISPYCASITMYPFLLDGIKGIGGLSTKSHNLNSFCGMYINLIFATSSMFAGAVATSEFLLYFTYFCKKEWGNNFYLKPDIKVTTEFCNRQQTIRSQIHQYWQQVIYSINQPSAARGLQSAFVNFSYFDKPFFEGMFGNFYFPDGSQPDWESLKWIQEEFMQWFNKERLVCMLTFPVESFTLLYKNGEFIDKESAKFVAEEYARGHSFFTYISDTVDSLSSCCRLKNKIQTKEFNFTNGNIGIQTGSKSVITLNLNRIIQNWFNQYTTPLITTTDFSKFSEEDKKALKNYIISILERVYKYHIAYNEYLWDMYNANLLPVYKAGFIDLDKQYLTIGINGLNQAAEFLGLNCNNNKRYKDFCQLIFSTIKESNTKNNGKFNNHVLTFNTECVPAESLAHKNYVWDKKDGYKVSSDINLYASYIFKPNDTNISILDKFILHGSEYIGDFLDGGAACHINLENHLSVEQYNKLIKFAAEVGCQYFTFNIPNSECDDCGYITKHPIEKCPKCSSTHINLWDRPIGYLSKVKNWSEARQIERKIRVYSKSI
ncbi:putative anaerobic ribonucleoside triphosphate reductase [uncultured phage cr116_1]|uniref:Putative anaerobic ribonucleoside triphosphate reductase n=1 Tax=uncultured phage cr116_1 TaxID=2772073 RepID=A0A7M1RY58_9CAUD|nr:anaerobic ribonucleoside reductase large subunit [uncultured phage cr116_1]QOR59375.1 putative anaerobic ribonucleoside triphosphate reductase [uncultured phage cr116_1]DAK53050.1 MAG TPA: anaerobic ribonucleoside triphosphate reductase [Crassvirales sp.]